MTSSRCISATVCQDRLTRAWLVQNSGGVISPNFIKKKWTDYELRGLISKEIYQGRAILPIWYNISPREVMEFSPTLADKIAVITEGRDVTDVAIQIFREVQPEQYLQYKRSGLVRLAQGKRSTQMISKSMRARFWSVIVDCYCCER